ncbi:hypothetical protein GCM10010300_85970 [Streptomyces olivaceoviridis]|nr:hypothetical protein GCM10010300_85970 [Streptomyces olivaceoviridis]
MRVPLTEIPNRSVIFERTPTRALRLHAGARVHAQGPKRQSECPHCANRVVMSLRNLRWIDPQLKTPGIVQP